MIKERKNIKTIIMKKKLILIALFPVLLLFNSSIGHYLGAGTGTTIAYYQLQSNANDLSGNAYNLTTTTNTTYSATTGKFGAGAICTASSVLYLAAATPAIQPTGTMSAWVYMTAYPTSGNYFSFLAQSSNTNTYYFEFRINNSGYIILVNASSTSISFTSAKAQIPLSKWTHILCTYSLGIPTASFYMNGAFMDTPTPTGTYTTVGTLDHCLCVGCSYLYSSPQDELVGNICEVIFENTQWSASKISRYYSYCTGKFVTK